MGVFAYHFAMFLAACGLAWWQRYSARDLMWSLWLTTLVLCIARVVSWSRHQPWVFKFNGWPGILIPLNRIPHTELIWPAFTCLIALMGHVIVVSLLVACFQVVGTALHQSFPLVSDVGASVDVDGFWMTLLIYSKEIMFEVLKRYWIFLLIFIASRWRPLLRMARGHEDPISEIVVFTFKAGFLMTIVGALQLFRVSEFLIYILAYSAFFFPWKTGGLY